MNALNRVSDALNRMLIFIGGILLVAMIAMTCANIFMRLTWVPLRGTFELMGYCGAVVTAFALGYTQRRKGHIAVDVVILAFSPGIRRVLAAVNAIVCMGFFSVATWQIVRKAQVLMRTGEVTETLRIVYYPFTFAVALGCLTLTLVFLTDLIQAILPKKEDIP
jgi:TRAP-type C4-dicarboxylate transport system permease small subunit